MTVTATNAGGTASIDVTVQVENLDDPGVVSASPREPAVFRANGR